MNLAEEDRRTDEVLISKLEKAYVIWPGVDPTKLFLRKRIIIPFFVFVVKLGHFMVITYLF